ncbi:MAG TPA: hypothetical protein VFI96_01850 [Longimicrobiaceae bacterium]|nr:hypothetical protein [Longimicrobiaceae bacterium]
MPMPIPPDDSTKGEAFAALSAAMVAAHAKAGVHPGTWVRVRAHYQRTLAWKRGDGGRSIVVMQGKHLTPDQSDRDWFVGLLPLSIQVVQVKEDREKHQVCFLLDRTPAPEPQAPPVPPSTPQPDRAGEHLPHYTLPGTHR